VIRTVVVDDEPPARRKLQRLLAGEPDVQVVGEASSGAEALELLSRTQPDVAFLDIQLPDCTGFDVLDALPSRDRMHLVFVTAHSDFALKAFEVHATDYLLKPVEPSRFVQTLSRVRRMLQAPDSDGVAKKLDELMRTLRPRPNYVRRLLIQDGERAVFLDVELIDWVESARNYVCVHSGERTHVMRSSLESLAGKLDPAAFRRISRSEIVNVNRIAEVRTWFHGDGKVILKSGKELNWSRRYRGGSLEQLERS
jgi:two-component system LytT family response regulator